MVRFVLLFLTVFSIAQCSVHSCEGEDETNLIGQWQLIERLIDPGDGSGRYKKVNSDRVLEIFEDGRVTFNESICTPDTSDGDSTNGIYNEDQTIIIPDCHQGNVLYRFRIEGPCLILSPLCIEGCGDKYVRI